MYEPYPSPPHRINKKFARALLPLLVWLAVALSLKYGNYGNHRLVLGSNSSRMVKTSSIFVKEINAAKGIPTKKGLFIYGFSDKPKLGSVTNRRTRYSMFLDSYGCKKFSMWLNKGSKISINWNVVVHGGASNGELLLVLIKGESGDHHDLKGLKRYDHHLGSHGNNNMNYVVKEDNRYNIEIENLNPQSIELDLNVSVSSTMYDTTKATSFCSLTSRTTCKLKLDFPRTHYFVFTTPSNEDDSDELEIVIAFTGRIVMFFFIFGMIMAIFWIIIKQVQGCQPTERIEEVMENEPILATKEATCNYGTSEDPETSLSGSFTDIYDDKICILCYDQNKACFFTPCGHSISCFSCAQRIMKEDNRICPVCRRLIQKIRKLPSL